MELIPPNYKFGGAADNGGVVTNFAWVLAGATAAGAGGAVANWAVYNWVFYEAPGYNPSFGVAGGAVYAALAGGLLSFGRSGPVGTVGQLLHAAFATAFAGLMIPTCCILVGVWLPALGGGLLALAALWATLWLCGVRAGPTRRLGRPSDAEPAAEL